MRFATRVFLWSFLPFAVLLMGSFSVIQKLVESTVRDGLRSSLRDTHFSIARMRSKSELQNSRFLRVVGENPALKAGLQLLLAAPKSGDARLTVEDQLREICGTLGFDLLVVSSAEGAPLAGVLRVGGKFVGLEIGRIQPPQRGLLTVEGRAYQVTSVPVDQGDENIGILSLGEHFDFSEFHTPAVLTHNGAVLKSNIPGLSLQEVESALRGCKQQTECEVRLDGETFLSLPMDSINFGEGYMLRSLQSVDSATGPVESILRDVFLIAGIGALLATSILGVLSSRSIVKPIGRVVSHLRESEKTGLLPEFDTKRAPIREIRELSESFNRASRAIREARQSLHRAYVEFVGSLASALDARDRYTAGHSRRVSESSCAIAAAMNMAESLAEIRIGALLHDIGKIGIPDSVLQKPGRLTDQERALIQEHPTIGHRILQAVHGFRPYLPVVELHHENWDGTGYPHGLVGDATPLAARIVHVADAYDAMTSDRPYRRGMTHEVAIRELEQHAGTQFDPVIVPIFAKLMAIGEGRRLTTPDDEPAVPSIQNLAEAVSREEAPSLPQPSEERKV